MARQTGLQYTFSTQKFPSELVLVDLTWNESVFAPFVGQIHLASRNKTLEAKQFLDTQGQIKLYQDGVLQRTWSGNISAFEQGNIGVSRRFYSLTIEPSLTRLRLRQNCRIFQQKSVIDILALLLKEGQIDNYALSLRETYPKREYCVQYNETDLDFIHRLLAEVGIYYYFEQNENDYNLIFVDHSAPLSLEQPIAYRGNSGGVPGEALVQDFVFQKALKVTKVSLNDYHFKNPPANYQNPALTTELQGQAQIEYEHYQYPGRYKDNALGQNFAKIRLQALRNQGQTAKGQSKQPLFMAGIAFELSHHPDPKANQSWLLTEVLHQGRQPQALEEEAGDKPTTYHNWIQTLPATLAFKLDPLPKPHLQGPQCATVVGPEGESIYCDPYGRIKIQFPWDLYADGRENSSCWIRATDPWAGQGYGLTHLPRIGHQVLVHFMDGDPDQPIVYNQNYHADNQPPYELPKNKTKTVWRSKTHQGEGYNEISFEDQADQEQIFIHAQKNLKEQINNDRITDIDHDEHLSILDDQFHQIKGNQNLTVGQDKKSQIKGNLSQETGQQTQYLSNQDTLIESETDIHLSAEQLIAFYAQQKIEINAGGGCVEITPGLIKLIAVSLPKAQGSAPKAALAYAGAKPFLPGAVEPPAPPPPLTDPILITPFEEPTNEMIEAKSQQLCQQQSDGSCPLADCPCGKNQAA